ncbi:MAG: T9SS type A sorting domain-containing protein [Crocinitomicaceae bacterium]|nr:T9SS type A sorting domain-containing protein [Crocinitomicaceae bacterium]
MARLLLTTTLFFTSFAFGQYCLTGGPTSPNDSNIESVSLFGDAGGITYTGCPGVTGVEQYNSQSVTLGAGSNYTISVQFGTCGGNYGGSGEVWIDFNQNGVFETTESIGIWAGTPPTAQSIFNFTVPGTAMMGATKMRINQQENSTLPLDPCASYTWGSSTDFLINIQGGIDCTGYTGDDFSDARPVSTYPFSENYSNSICYSSQNPVYISPDVYYLLTSFSALSSLSISTCGSGFDTFLTVTDAQGNPIAINDDSPNCGPQSEINIATTGHDSLYVIVEGWNNQIGDYTLNIGQGIVSVPTIEESTFSLFPNPANSSVFFEGAQGGVVTLIDSRGETVKNMDVSNKQEIDLSGLASGMYVFKIQTESTVSMKKLLIK